MGARRDDGGRAAQRDVFAARLGSDGATLLEGLSDDDVEVLAAAVAAAADREARAAAGSLDPALNVVPRLLRPAVKRVLGR